MSDRPNVLVRAHREVFEGMDDVWMIYLFIIFAVAVVAAVGWHEMHPNHDPRAGWVHVGGLTDFRCDGANGLYRQENSAVAGDSLAVVKNDPRCAGGDR